MLCLARPRPGLQPVLGRFQVETSPLARSLITRGQANTSQLFQTAVRVFFVLHCLPSTQSLVPWAIPSRPSRSICLPFHSRSRPSTGSKFHQILALFLSPPLPLPTAVQASSSVLRRSVRCLGSRLNCVQFLLCLSPLQILSFSSPQPSVPSGLSPLSR